MNVLVVGSGGREHALVWKLRQSPMVTHIYCAPGNVGIAEIADVVAIPVSDLEGLLRFAIQHNIELTVVGPETPLTEGIVDRFESARLKIFGPSRLAAQLESSKVFAKEFMSRYRIPTAEFRTFTRDQRFDAERYVHEIPVPIVVKADGLAAGKGVTICETKEQALEVLDALMSQRLFGEAGERVVIEEFLEGEEASVFAVCDGQDFVVLPPARDHKRIFDDDQGKNTGGMGSFAPAFIVSGEVLEQVKRRIIRPTLLGMKKEGRPYKGILYVGLMITQTGPKVVEYNCRFGDPETQVVLPLIDNDLAQLMLDAIDGRLAASKVKVKDQCAVCIVIASGGYPDRYEVGKAILGLDAVRIEHNVEVFHGGTSRERDQVVTAGGRVLGVTAIGGRDDLEATIHRAYHAVGKITFDGAYYRSDIGKKSLDRWRQQQEKESA